MIHKEQNFNSDDMQKAMRLIRIYIRNNALHHFKHIDIRTLRSLQTIGLFKGDPISIDDNVDISVLQDSEHPRREKLPVGPLVLYSDKDDKSKHMLVELPVLLFSEMLHVRKTALECLDKMIQSKSHTITPRTRQIIQNFRKPLLSDNLKKWKPAAITISDALYDDVLVALQTVHQCLEHEPVIQDFLNSSAPKLFRPSISSLASITLDISNPENEHEKMTELINKIVEHAKNLAAVCEEYYETLGYLPLAPRYGMAEAVQHWMVTHSNTDAWTEIWDWAHSALGPIPRYHACCVFILHPELVPQGKLPDLWTEILDVVCISGRKDDDEIGNEAWALRSDLTRHYAYHLEAHLPDSNSANIGCFAWWFSEQVAALFPDNPASIRFYREKWVQSALEISSAVWLVASPYINSSLLRYMTFSVISPWAVGLLSILCDKIERLAPDKQSDEVRARFHNAIVSHFISIPPFSEQSPINPTFAIESSLAEMILKWAEYQPDEQRKALEQLVATNNEIGTTDGLCTALRKFGESPPTVQIVVAFALRARAYIDPTIAKSVWEIIDDADWRSKVFSNTKTEVLALLMEVFLILQINNRDKWFSLFPHYIAELCEKTDDEERRHQLFLYVLHASLASDTISAVRRLLRGSHKAKFIKLADDYRGRFEALRSYYPPWVAGKLRGLIANLHIV